MRHRATRYAPESNDLDRDDYPPRAYRPPAYDPAHDDALLRRLEHVEYLTRTALWPARTAQPAEAVRPLDTVHSAQATAVSHPAPRPTPANATSPEQTLWQGRPAFRASACTVLSAATWTSLWGLALLQSADLATHLEWSRPHVQAWLFEQGAFGIAAWYAQGLDWLLDTGTTHATLNGVLLVLTVSAGLVLLTRLLRALHTSYRLTTQCLRTYQGGRFTDVPLAELERVTIRRPFWGRRLGYVHLRFAGEHPVRRRVQWWGVPQRALLQSLLQAAMHQARSATSPAA